MGGGFNQAQNFYQMGMQQQAQQQVAPAPAAPAQDGWKCGWQPEDPTKAPKFCPECGDIFDNGDLI
jgi:membrane protease subunit (stomatin/prohibitin family)